MSVSTSQSKYTVEALDGYFAPKPESPKRDWKEPESFGLLLSGGWRELDEAITSALSSFLVIGEADFLNSLEQGECPKRKLRAAHTFSPRTR